MNIKWILIASCIALMSIVGISLYFMLHTSPQSGNNTIITGPTPLPTVSIPSITPIRPPVQYQAGSIDKEVNAITNKQPLSSQDAAVRSKLIQNLGGISGTLNQTPDYSLRYLQPLDIFEAEIISTDIASAKHEVVSWFENQGISADGICKLPITFYLNRNTAEQLHGSGIVFNPLPDECK